MCIYYSYSALYSILKINKWGPKNYYFSGWLNILGWNEIISHNAAINTLEDMVRFNLKWMSKL